MEQTQTYLLRACSCFLNLVKEELCWTATIPLYIILWCTVHCVVSAPGRTVHGVVSAPGRTVHGVVSAPGCKVHGVVSARPCKSMAHVTRFQSRSALTTHG